MTITYPKRLIEVDLPIRRISEHARREKSIRHGHISTLHIWWARRPLAACRAVICAALWPDPADDLCPQSFRDAAAKAMADFAAQVRTEKPLQELCRASRTRWWRTTETTLNPKNPGCWGEIRYSLLEFIADFANWDASTDPVFLQTARTLTQAAHEALGGTPGTRPLVVDPFAGGGSIPLEALRVGADAFASDLNPVAVLLNKVVLEYIPKYGRRLADEARKWGEWVGQELTKRLKVYYPWETDGSTPSAFIWARVILSESPDQGDVPIEIPLMRSMWIAKRSLTPQAFRWVRDENGQILTELTEVEYGNDERRLIRRPLLEIFKPSSANEVEKGTSQGGAATCPITGFTTSVESVRRQLKKRNGGANDARLLCIVSTSSNSSRKKYCEPNSTYLTGFYKAKTHLKELQNLKPQNSPLIPDGEINHLRGFFNIVLYGLTKWSDLFSARQMMALVTITQLVQEVETHSPDPSFQAAIRSFLALCLGRCADKCSNLVIWNNLGENVEHVFGRQALPMIWDFAEANILADIGWKGACEWVLKVIQANVEASFATNASTVALATATNHPLPSDIAEACISDPPYYSAIPYADLADFFYSWMKRSLEKTHPDLFHAELSPKDDECVSLSHRASMYRYKDNRWFEMMMCKACSEARRFTKPYGIGVWVFANKETSGWEAMLSALIESGWIITASWPIDTERGARLRAHNSAALASSIHLVCRPREDESGKLLDTVGDWRDVLQELPKRIHSWLPRLAHEGVVGADAIFACLGPALEIFSRHSRVERANGDQVTLREYLEQVWAAVSREALTLVFAGADTSGFEEDARLTAMWLWTLGSGGESRVQGSGFRVQGSEEEVETVDSNEDEGDESGGKPAKVAGFTLEFDAARKIAQGLGAHLEKLASLVEVKGDKARLLPVSERTKHLFGKDEATAPTKARKKQVQRSFFEELDEAAPVEDGWGEKNAPKLGITVLDRIHQAMILFAAGRGEALKSFLVSEGAGDERFWRLAQALSALYPPGTDEKRWVDGVLARKKGLGF